MSLPLVPLLAPLLLPLPLTSAAVFCYLALTATALGYAYFRHSRRRLYELAAKIPGPRGLPLVGHALHTIVKIFKTVLGYANEFPQDTPLKLWIGPVLYVAVVDPRDIEAVLGSSEHLDKSGEYNFFRPWFGNGLLISSGDHWRAHRKLIAPTFHLSVLKSFVELFNANSRGVVEKMRKEAKAGHEFDVHEYMSEATVEILLETAMGVSKKEQKSGLEYALAVMKMCDILHMRHTRFWLYPDLLFRLSKHFGEQTRLLGIIHGLTKRVIQSKKAEFLKGVRGPLASDPIVSATPEAPKEAKPDIRAEDNDVGQKQRLAFLELLIESSQNGAALTDQDIKEEVDTIMFEGHDTTAAGSSFFLCMMGLYPDIQDRVVEELDQIFGDSDRAATFQDTLRMKYLERCLMETLRLYPPVPIIGRKLKHDDKMPSTGALLPAGCTVMVGIYKVHRDPAVYPDPEAFNPDNFLPERCANRHYYSFVPFSAGPRSCVGRKYAVLKLKILLSTILRSYRVGATVPEKDWKLTGDVILKRADGFRISLQPRRTKADTAAPTHKAPLS
ncbi:hypothetical protein ONE63_007788 [Megalurothrips usitatus]|uniref:Cytochrome P450 4g15 n=1 Tax=Megalurothrips usitatus TaxID=439358 RepID=A0AAV7XT17_9NEOP|nr:hypothetical protein ONE63_007788 [Megalurothrips usitatus]